MKILEVDSENYRVFGDSLKIDDKLPAAVYTVCFNKMQGFWLHKREDLKVTEKLYGKHEEKVNKLLRSYEKFDRSMGVIFSGDKGIGKSIAARMLCEKSVEKGMPVIMIDENIPGIADFIDSIKQECVVLFDEFEKNFTKVRDRDGDEIGNNQDALLSLFDGTSSSYKRMYLITCNELYQLSDFLVNRPGRFHYHIRWDYPTANEIEQYLEDKVEEQYWGEIKKVLAFAARVKLNYDCLRAIAFELNLGSKFEEAIDDLNIKNVESESYNVYVELEDGTRYSNRNENIDLFKMNEEHVRVWGENNDDAATLHFIPRDVVFAGKHVEIDLKTARFGSDRRDEKEPLKIRRAWLERYEHRNGYVYNVEGLVA